MDLLIAATIPSVSEAMGVAAGMSRTGIPSVISFVLDREGSVLDRISLRGAITKIDMVASPPPLFYLANCCHTTFSRAAMRTIERDDNALLHRIIDLQANTSAKEAGERDNLPHLDPEDPDLFAASMLALHRDFGTGILGGCCGTDEQHIAAIAERLGRTGAQKEHANGGS